MAKKQTWWILKYVEPATGCERIGPAAYDWKQPADRSAQEYRELGAKNVRVVPCDPPKLWHPIKRK